MSEDIEYCLYVKNIPRNVQKNDIEDLFSNIADIKKLTVLTDPTTKAFKGVAFVSYATENECLKAIHEYHNSKQWGNIISVSFSDKTKERLPPNEKEAILSMAEDLKKRSARPNRTDEVNKSLSFVAPIEIMLGSLVDAGERREDIKEELSMRMLPLDLKEVDELLFNLLERVMARRQKA
ncbi:hypothetical protein TVAG_222640 [Trichomonas vaginalis G3]|uniref:RRM domain-containing protein n=1 Tax=Trichomonas vaginalis (strain ATCC PRA-98 / G3) TaxID=412133 RepID=A2F5E0_TRIV3|nr:RNA-binding domain, RBD family-containing protein [Trichomonas vaginalis G3]EAX99903.1 hypothetical protein TVAG_222640 [Trichomonas vaginalis G3]KAI5492912.1 RNA-binding domain, RBD family-containing protein [Trichomonas vaginalis G3]|eukprot:XP_001312833.1 hypothetical protein [Trichomonas vaginalis G3]